MTDWDKLNPPVQPSQALIKRKKNEDDLASQSVQVQKRVRMNRPQAKVKEEKQVEEGEGKPSFRTDTYSYISDD